MYIQLMWEDPTTGEVHRPILTPPIAIGRDTSQMPEKLGEQPVSRLELAHKQVSRFHALITLANQQLYITDRSANGTFLNGRPIGKGSQPFASKDTLRMGPYKMIATLMQGADHDVTEHTVRDPVSILRPASVLPKNTLVIWLVGIGVLLSMGLGAWLLVSALLERSRPRVPVGSALTGSVSGLKVSEANAFSLSEPTHG
ncbi:FHA domain-containing protein [Leptolyngbya sp. FACHB-261]|uniref:FHA domain-containing protein n=1 Tax=Leptolyngbya sp. FACHB-261 TaxID=2692806 RepID=UPI0016838E17|nr:FHA domain-containing protein [Leptolyngbya sp. FACHB-261]MBD2105140.1 FHA domain-containing protein [Leptolyngbya sp. FACHB-261]